MRTGNRLYIKNVWAIQISWQEIIQKNRIIFIVHTLMKLPSLQRKHNANRLNLTISTCLILAFIIKFSQQSLGYLQAPDCINTYAYTEFLINFQGGFVRRGLLGEILYQIYTWFDYPLTWVITTISYLTFFFVLLFFLYQFHKKRYCWWIIFSPLFLGLTTFIVRKDFLLYAVLIGCQYLLRSTSPTTIKRFCACLLVILALFLHEAFMFWGFPIYALLLLSYRYGKIWNYILIFLPLAIFVILCAHKGSIETAHAIVDSWNSVLSDAPLAKIEENSIGALGWNSIDTFIFHFKKNINALEGGCGIIQLPLYFLGAYYLFTNFLPIFQNSKSFHCASNKLTLSLLYSFVSLCLIPMSTILSCDNGRVFQYASVATFSTFLIIPHNVIMSAFPKWYKHLILKFNIALNHFLPPNKGLMIILLFFIGMSPVSFSINTCRTQSVFDTILQLLPILFKSLTWFIHLFL